MVLSAGMHSSSFFVIFVLFCDFHPGLSSYVDVSWVGDSIKNFTFFFFFEFSFEILFLHFPKG